MKKPETRLSLLLFNPYFASITTGRDGWTTLGFGQKEFGQIIADLPFKIS